MEAVYVFIGGGLGALARYGVSWLFHPIGYDPSPTEFPWPTFISNLLACLLLGYGLGLLTRGQLSRPLQVLLLTGFCGGFSTFSTFASDVLRLYDAGAIGVAVLYVFASLLLGVLGVAGMLYLIGAGSFD